MNKIVRNIIEGLLGPLVTEYPFFFFSVIVLWQNTLFAIRSCFFEDVIYYSFLSLFHAYSSCLKALLTISSISSLDFASKSAGDKRRELVA